MDTPAPDERRPTILIVDDTPQNIKLQATVLRHHGYTVVSASSGEEALAAVAVQRPDLVLLDVVMPGLDGYAVCARLRADPTTRFLPVIMITASGEPAKLEALEVGADDFLHKPFDQAELLARVRTLLRIKEYHDTIQRQAVELAHWNRTLEERVQQQVDELDRLGRLRRFLSPGLAEILFSAEGEALLETHRRQIAVVSCRLVGFPALAESLAPEEVVCVLREYHTTLGEVVHGFEATVSTLDEDRLKVVLNDPLPCDDPAGQAVALALAMRDRLGELLNRWHKRGYQLGLGIGIDSGYATLGVIGFEGRTEYGAIGPASRLAWLLAEHAQSGQILATPRVYVEVEDQVEVGPAGELQIEGLTRPVMAYPIQRLRPSAGQAAEPASAAAGPARGPLTEREWQVVELITHGDTNRDIAEKLVIAEGTAVRHVTNILNKLGLRSRAQVAVWAVEQGYASRDT